jgi:hypothetical protein
MLQKDGDIDEDVRRRILVVWLNGFMLLASSMTRQCQKHVSSIGLLSVMLYGVDCWSTKRRCVQQATTECSKGDLLWCWCIYRF